MTSYGMREKKVVFYDTDKRHADLRLRLQHDDFTQSEFFCAMVTGYIEKDPRVISFLYEWRQENKNYSKKKRKNSEKLLDKGEKIKSKFGLDQDEIESIFDLLEQDHPEL